ncbi:MAG: polyprenyl synthetase family protein, partial [Rhodospirillales bacterium]
MTELTKALAETAEKVNAVIAALIPRTDAPENRLYDAMRYSAMAGGKRLRPFLVMQGAALFNV